MHPSISFAQTVDDIPMDMFLSWFEKTLFSHLFDQINISRNDSNNHAEFFWFPDVTVITASPQNKRIYLFKQTDVTVLQGAY